MNLAEQIADYRYGISHNFVQFTHQLIQVFLVGLTLGMTRTVIPALAESEFGVTKGSFVLLTAFVVAFGFVKGTLNFIAGRLSEHYGRKQVLLWGWLIALPIPLLIYYAPSWNWIVAATILLGINQGLTWSMTQTAKLDLTLPEQRGLTIGLNEFSGYFGVATAGIITGYLATAYGPRLGLLLFGLTIITLASILTILWVQDTLPWAQAEGKKQLQRQINSLHPHYPLNISLHPTTWEIFTLMSWRDLQLASISQAGLVEKFVDALIWVFFPLYLHQHGLDLTRIGWIIGVYGFTWGIAQIFTGHWSDHVGRKIPIVGGMWLCGTGVNLIVLGIGTWWWSFAAALAGFGMALLYPTLSAAISDIAHPNWRGSAIGIYRFWRDLGYGIGALALGGIATIFDSIEAGFIFTALAMFISGTIVLLFCAETHPSLNPSINHYHNAT